MSAAHSEDPDAKVLFRVPREGEDDDSEDVETLWAYSLGDDRYKLDNVPLFAYGVSWHDVVYAPYDPDEQRAAFRSVVSKSGNRTVRIIFDIPAELGNGSRQLVDELVALGCSYEGFDSTMIAVNIPPEADFDAVVDLLVDSDEDWEYADPTYEEMNPDEK